MWKRDQSGDSSAAPRPAPEAPPPARTAPAEPLVMNLGDSVVIKGELSGSEDLTLYGQMQGSVKLPEHTLTIGPKVSRGAKRAHVSVRTLSFLAGPTPQRSPDCRGRQFESQAVSPSTVPERSEGSRKSSGRLAAQPAIARRSHFLHKWGKAPADRSCRTW